MMANYNTNESGYSLQNLKYDGAELEDMITKQMIQDCKLDACLDVFLDGLAKIQGPKHGSWWKYRALPDPATFGVDDAKTYQKIANQLRENLNRVLPGYLEEDDRVDIIRNERLKDGLERRWRRGVKGLFATGNEPADLFQDALLETLSEQEYQKRVSHDQPCSLPTPLETVEACSQLRRYIEDETEAASFACGGTILISTTTGDALSPGSSSPINIFWSVGGDHVAHRLTLPSSSQDAESHNTLLRRLVQDCDPATFGRGDRDILDPEYRKAGKMDPSTFATSFHPAEFGIIEKIEQLLLPSISNETQNRLGFRRLTAELYKLNVYSGPLGLFRKHVDTPRSENQVGSLVVCLPSPFKGGMLTVYHNQQQLNFNWSPQSESTIQWAAFYSDCEHEIQTVTEGDRITLTYNLFVNEVVGSIHPPCSIIQPQLLPLYGFMKDLVSKPEFMQQGGVLGIFCSHAYPHTSKLAKLELPQGLKGADLVLYTIFGSLGIKVDIRPVLEFCGKYGSENPDLGIKGVVKGKKNFYFSTSDYYDHSYWREYLTGDKVLNEIPFTEILPNRVVKNTDIDRYWKLLMMSRQVRGMRDLTKVARQEDVAIRGVYANDGARVGIKCKRYFTTHRGQDEHLDDVGQDVWPASYLPGIVWINEPKHEEMAFSQVSYGNQAAVGTRYCCVAILAVIPPFSERLNLSGCS